MGASDTLDTDYGKVTWKTDTKGSRVLRTASFKYKNQELTEQIIKEINFKIDNI